MKWSSVKGKLVEDTGIIESKNIILVEGQDEVLFFHELLKKLKILSIEAHEVGGKDNFRTKMPAFIKNTGFKKVENLGIIRDADGNINAAFDSITGTLKKIKIDPPEQINYFSKGKPRTGIFIINDMLEELCLNTVKDSPAMKCVNVFNDCTSKLTPSPKNILKSKAQAYLAAMECIVKSVGLGASKGYWDLSSNGLNELKDFIGKLIK